jgi:hypothetical protein
MIHESGGAIGRLVIFSVELEEGSGRGECFASSSSEVRRPRRLTMRSIFGGMWQSDRDANTCAGAGFCICSHHSAREGNAFSVPSFCLHIINNAGAVAVLLFINTSPITALPAHFLPFFVV